jgi:uncharacterized membrane protein YuzA (DUF378 family)
MDLLARSAIWLEMLTLALIIVGALNWGLIGVFKFDLVAWAAKATGLSWLKTAVYILVGVAAVLHLFSRDYYLRFLGKTAFPCGPLVQRIPDSADTEVTVRVDPDVNVVYWAAEPTLPKDAFGPVKVQPTPWIGYDKWANAGVVRSDKDGLATLRVRRPTPYRAGLRTIPVHIHYRVCSYPGMLGRVETVDV